MEPKLYKTELHCHSRDVSECAHESAEGIVSKYLRYGYSTVVLTNHFSQYAYRMQEEREVSWEEVSTYFLNGWRILKRAAEGTPLNILLGVEIRFPPYENDYLLFGVTEEYIINHENMYCTDLASFHKMSKEDGLLLIQAHPFRFNMHIINPADVDGYEVYNGSPNRKGSNSAALEYAKGIEGCIMTSGSDHHNPDHFPDAGIMTDFEIKTNDDLLAVLRSGTYTLIEDEEIRLGKKRL